MENDSKDDQDLKTTANRGMIQSRVFSPVRREFMSVWMMAGDLIAFAAAGLLAIQLRLWIGEAFSSQQIYFDLWPLLFIFPMVYAVGGLYPGVGITPVEEMGRLTRSTSAVMIAITAVLFFIQQGVSYSRLLFVFFWAAALILVPVIRFVSRRFGLRFKVWGESVALIGFGPQGKKVLAYLRSNQLSGLIPVVIVDGDAAQNCDWSDDPRLPRIHMEELIQDHLLLKRMGIQNVVIVPNETPAALQQLLVNEEKFSLRRLILISNLGWAGGSAVRPLDLQGVLGLEMERNLLKPVDRLVKRGIELMIVLGGSIVAVPVILLCTLLVRLDSPGPIFYRQKRLGRHGRDIYVVKFRTMIPNADAVLEECLNCDEERRAEWDATHKLINDPRVTRIGVFLRKTSLDELPQLWNVLKGEMSLVGPRPIVQGEMKHYQESFGLYSQVFPGITGLWQVSGRSDTSYANRVELDEYYIRHWSIWLDIYILIRTIWVVIKHTGAY